MLANNADIHTPSDDQLLVEILDSATVPCRTTTLVSDMWQDDDLGPGHAAFLCRACPVRQACLQRTLRLEAQTGEHYGIAGGTTPQQRAAMIATGPVTPATRTIYAATWTVKEVLAYLASRGYTISRVTWLTKIKNGTAPKPIYTGRRGQLGGQQQGAQKRAEWDSLQVRLWASQNIHPTTAGRQ